MCRDQTGLLGMLGGVCGDLGTDTVWNGWESAGGRLGGCEFIGNGVEWMMKFVTGIGRMLCMWLELWLGAAIMWWEGWMDYDLLVGGVWL